MRVWDECLRRRCDAHSLTHTQHGKIVCGKFIFIVRILISSQSKMINNERRVIMISSAIGMNKMGNQSPWNPLQSIYCGIVRWTMRIGYRLIHQIFQMMYVVIGNGKIYFHSNCISPSIYWSNARLSAPGTDQPLSEWINYWLRRLSRCPSLVYTHKPNPNPAIILNMATDNAQSNGTTFRVCDCVQRTMKHQHFQSKNRSKMNRKKILEFTSINWLLMCTETSHRNWIDAVFTKKNQIRKQYPMVELRAQLARVRVHSAMHVERKHDQYKWENSSFPISVMDRTPSYELWFWWRR